MNRTSRWSVGVLLFLSCLKPAQAAEPAWLQMTNPTSTEVAAKFTDPPPEYCNSVTWGWNGPMTEEVITRDLDTLHARGFRIATIEAGYRMDNAPYLSEDWFKLIRFAGEQARARGMRLIIIDEGKYPSGFVNGKYTRERPDLRMQALVGGMPEQVAGGQSYDKQVDPNTVSAIAYKSDGATVVPLEIADGRIHWTAPEGTWTVVTARHDFRTPQTRAVSDATQAKTTTNSMGDLINPEATQLFIQWTHEEYRKHVGDLFGNSIIAFRGDEPEMTGVPWTPAIAEEFQKRKGYDVRPYLASFIVGGRGARGGGAAAGPRMTEEQRRAKADYFDVWSELFAKNFFDAQAAWCAANGVAATTHLNNDHNLPALVATTGDFFRALRSYQAPGVDVIWNQVWPGKVADFVRFPVSSAHLSGHTRVLSETFAAFTPPAGIDEARFAVNYELVRGITLFEYMFYQSSASRGGPATAPAAGAAAAAPAARGRGYMGDDKFPALAAYSNRLTYALSQGRPASQIAIYVPTMSQWLGDNSGNAVMLTIAQSLSENQRDFDFVDDISIARNMKLAGGAFVNASGQSYRAVIVPTSTAVSKEALARLQTFAKAGGKVAFLGTTPTLAIGQTFLHAEPVGDLSWATLEPSGEVTPAVLAALPKSDVAFDAPCADVKVMHRTWKNAEVYFFFNESDKPQKVSATLAGSGNIQQWNAENATMTAAAGATSQGGSTHLPLDLEGYGARFIVIVGDARAEAF